ncbi:MAG: HEAT repeat domain-containing protein [Candidatus Ratteibacteria bacterium]|jgi:hypothetical protein
MKKRGFPGLLFLTLFAFAVVWVSKSEGAVGTAPTVATVTKITKDDMVGMIKPTLEKYLTNHPDPLVRVWSMVLLVNTDKIDEQKVSSIPVLVLQLGNKDENIRQIALNSIRAALTLDDKEWKGIMGTVFRTIAKTTKYPEEGVKKLAIKSLSMLQDLDEESLNSLALLFDLTQDSDPEIRQAALEAINGILSSKEKKSSVGSGGVG